MADGPLIKPSHLAPSPHPRPAALVTAVLGTLTFIVVAIARPELWATPEWWISVPGFALTGVAGLVSVARRERAWAPLGLGLGLAAAALVLGWLFGAAIVLAALIIVIAVLHAVL